MFLGFVKHAPSKRATTSTISKTTNTTATNKNDKLDVKVKIIPESALNTNNTNHTSTSLIDIHDAHTNTVLFSLLGAFFAMILASFYWSVPQDAQAVGEDKNVTNKTLQQPFSTFSNLSYIFVSIYVLQIKDNPSFASVAGIFLATLGAGSFAYHLNNAKCCGNEEAFDRVFLLIPFTFFLPVSIYGTALTFCFPRFPLTTPSTSRSSYHLSFSKMQTNAYTLTVTLSVISTVTVVLFEKRIALDIYTISCGAIILLFNFLSVLRIEFKARKMHGIKLAFLWLSTQLGLLILAYFLLKRAQDTSEYDLIHGTWHYVTCIAASSITLTIRNVLLQQSMSAKIVPYSFKWCQIVVFASILYETSNNLVWICTWISTFSIVIAFLALAHLYRLKYCRIVNFFKFCNRLR